MGYKRKYMFEVMNRCEPYGVCILQKKKEPGVIHVKEKVVNLTDNKQVLLICIRKRFRYKDTQTQ